jgi:SAM-dependent methyltransferase
METEKARQRRLREGFFRDFIQPDKKGIDVGAGGDPITENCIQWERTLGDMDAMRLQGILTGEMDWIYSSHCLEDLDNPWAAVREWWRVLKPGGFMCIMVPHRDLFECRKTLPSAGNANHRTFWLPDRNEPPVTLGLVPLVSGVCQDSELMYCKTCDEGYRVEFRPMPSAPHIIQVIANGEFSIEAIWRKRIPMMYVEDMILPEQLGMTNDEAQRREDFGPNGDATTPGFLKGKEKQ